MGLFYHSTQIPLPKPQTLNPNPKPIQTAHRDAALDGEFVLQNENVYKAKQTVKQQRL